MGRRPETENSQCPLEGEATRPTTRLGPDNLGSFTRRRSERLLRDWPGPPPDRTKSHICYGQTRYWGFPAGTVIKNCRPMPMQETRETWGQSLGREDSLEEEMATRSGILAWRTPGTEEPGGLQSTGLSDYTRTHAQTTYHCLS